MKEQSLFAKRLSFLIKAGSPIIESLGMLKNYRSKAKIWIFEEIISGVANGQYLSKSMEKFRYIFGDFAINMIRVGESIGALDQNLNYLAEELKKKRELRSKIITSLVYPIFIIFATLGIVLLLLVFVLPKVLPVFTSLKIELPLATRIIIGASAFAIKYGGYILLAGALLAVAFYFLNKKNEKIRYKTHQIILKIPLVGKMTQSYQLTNFCRTFGLLAKSGLAMYEVMTIIAASTPNLVYKKEFEKLAENVSMGRKIHSQLAKNPKLFPEIIIQMIATGEASGNLSETLIYLSEMYENEFDDLTKNLSSALEPVLMITMGLIVGFIAISIITPIYEITQHLTPR